jgi:hypothetical protein
MVYPSLNKMQRIALVQEWIEFAEFFIIYNQLHAITHYSYTMLADLLDHHMQALEIILVFLFHKCGKSCTYLNIPLYKIRRKGHREKLSYPMCKVQDVVLVLLVVSLLLLCQDAMQSAAQLVTKLRVDSTMFTHGIET